MKAYRLVAWQKPGEFQEVPVPEPGPGQVLIKIGGAGACHSDLHLMDWAPGLLPYDLPFTLGHENAGWVESIGAGVTGFSHGDPVIVYGPWGCGECYICRQGVENYCERGPNMKYAGGGLGVDGGMAPYMLVPASRFLVRLDRLDPKEAAPLTDAGLTSYHAIRRSVGLLHAGSAAVIIGVGGLGHLGVQIVKAISPARVIAVDVSEEKLKLAAEVGADNTIIAGENAAQEILALTEGQGAELVVDMVGSDQTMLLGTKAVRRMGQLTIVGLALGSFTYNFFTLPYDANLAATFWGTIPELFEVVELAEAGKIKSHNQYFSLEEAPKAYELMRKGELEGRAVIVP